MRRGQKKKKKKPLVEILSYIKNILFSKCIVYRILFTIPVTVAFTEKVF
jgi:hypothetical protein